MKTNMLQRRIAYDQIILFAPTKINDMFINHIIYLAQRLLPICPVDSSSSSFAIPYDYRWSHHHTDHKLQIKARIWSK